jgi:hypothetical protein
MSAITVTQATAPAAKHVGTRPDRPRRVPAPPSLPPYDDELVGDRTPPPASNALLLPLPFAAPAAPRRLRVVPGGPVTDSARHTGLPPAAAVAGSLVAAVLEGLAGRRPAAQLAVCATPAVCAAVARRAGAAARTRRSREPARLRSVHVSEPASGVAEVTAVVDLEGRVRALALRLEILAGRWRCTVLRMG